MSGKSQDIELQAIKDLAVHAGSILLKHYSTPPSVQWKGQNNPVTTADQAASRFLVAELKKKFPSDGILCEEELDDGRRLGMSRVWMVDPMDGTKEFIAHSGEFAVMVGLAIDGEPTLGVVHQPVSDKLYYAAAGHGAFLESGGLRQPLHVSAETDLSRITVAVSHSHYSAVTDAFLAVPGIKSIIRHGSSGLKVGLICERRADLYIHPGPGTNQWDTCGPEAILREAGGRMTDMLGRPLLYNIEEHQNRYGIIATNGFIHDAVVDAAKKAREAKS